MMAAVAACVLAALSTASDPLARAATTFGSPLAAEVHDLRACLSDLPTTQSRLLALRSGLGGRPIASQAQTATQLGLSLGQEQTQEGAAVARLRRLGRRAGCGSGQTSPAPAPSRAPAPRPTPTRAATPARSPAAAPHSTRSTGASPRPASGSGGPGAVPSSGGWKHPGPLIALGIAVLALAALLREVVRVVR